MWTNHFLICMKGNISYSCVDESYSYCPKLHCSAWVCWCQVWGKDEAVLCQLSFFVYSVQCCQSEAVGLNVENIRFKIFIFLPFGDTRIANVAFQGSCVWIDFHPSFPLYFWMSLGGSQGPWWGIFILSCNGRWLVVIQGPKRILHTYYRVNSAKPKKRSITLSVLCECMVL